MAAAVHLVRTSASGNSCIQSRCGAGAEENSQKTEHLRRGANSGGLWLAIQQKAARAGRLSRVYSWLQRHACDRPLTSHTLDL